MTKVFVSHAQEDMQCAETIRKDLENRGYASWREPSYPRPTDHTYPQMIENAILGSAVLVLIWSASAAQTAWVMRHTLFAQRLKKNILPIMLDNTALPTTLIVATTISGLTSCNDATTQLLHHLPEPDSQDSLLKLTEQASREYIGPRKEAIDQAAAMLARDEHREEVLATLEYLAQHDLMMGVREKAREALETDAQKQKDMQTPPSFLNPEDSRHIIGVRCGKCKQVTYFDKRRICTAKETRVRGKIKVAEKELDQMELPCRQCGHMISTHVDCEGYR